MPSRRRSSRFSISSARRLAASNTSPSLEGSSSRDRRPAGPSILLDGGRGDFVARMIRSLSILPAAPLLVALAALGTVARPATADEVRVPATYRPEVLGRVGV